MERACKAACEATASFPVCCRFKGLRVGGTGAQGPQENDAEESENGCDIASEMREGKHSCSFGGWAVSERPLALRPRLATGVPLSWCTCCCDRRCWSSSSPIGARRRCKTPCTAVGRMSARHVPARDFGALEERVARSGVRAMCKRCVADAQPTSGRSATRAVRWSGPSCPRRARP